CIGVDGSRRIIGVIKRLKSCMNCNKRNHRPRDLYSFPTRRSSDLTLLADQAPTTKAILHARQLMCSACHHRYTPRKAHAKRGCRSEEHTSELQSREKLVCRLLLEIQRITAPSL